MQSFRDDVEKIFANAKYFNQESSLVWQDADALEVSLLDSERRCDLCISRETLGRPRT